MNKIFLTLVILLSLFFSLINLNKWAFMDYDEATYAKVYHESSSRNLLSLTYFNEPWPDKPPLYFWLAKGSSILFGENEFSLRLPSALLTTASILFVFLIVLELTKDWTAALLSATVLLTTAYFIFTGRQLRLDVPVTSAILLSLYGFIKGREKPLWFLVFGFGVAEGVLFKSVIGLLIYPIILIFSSVFKDFRWLRNKWFWLGNMFALLLVIPWHLYQSFLFGDKFWSIYIGQQVLQRAGESLLPGAKPSFFYHFQQLFVVNQPWVLCFITLIASFLLTAERKLKNYPCELFTLLATSFIFFLFYIPQTRLLYYFTPMLPFMAMFIGAYGTSLLRKHKQLIWLALFLVMLGLLNTSLRIFSDKDRGFFLQPATRISRYTIANDERAVIELALKEKSVLYVYKWQFFPTLLYYSDIDGGVRMQELTKKSVLNPPYMLLIPSPLFTGSLRIPQSKEAGVEIVFKGDAATLVKVYTKN